MAPTIPILRARRERRLGRQRATAARKRSLFLGAGTILSVLGAALIITAAFAYVDLTRDLPSPQVLPTLLNPPDGLLLQPSRIYDRRGNVVLFTFAPDDSLRRYLPLSETNPQHLPGSLSDAVVATTDPYFWEHSGYTLDTLTEYELHPTLAQRLVFDLLLFQEAPSLRRALRERILAAQITARYGRMQILEWYLNAANFGRHAFGADAAARLYFGKSAAQLTTAESAILAAVSESPSLNPYDAPQTALERGREAVSRMQVRGLLSMEAADRARAESPQFRLPPSPGPQPAAAFVNLLLSQLDSQFPRERIERGGLTIISTLEYDLQRQASCVTSVYAARLAGRPDPALACEGLRYLPALPPEIRVEDSSASAMITDPATGQILAVVGETLRAQETPLLAAHDPGSLLDAFVYLTGFTRGLSPASLIWDIPGRAPVQNADGQYHGPLRLRIALANDYRAPAAQVLSQMGEENVEKISASFGLDREAELSLMDAAGAFGVFARQGVYFGQELGTAFRPVALLRVEGNDGSLWLDWSTPQARPVVTPGLAYLMNHALSDSSARRGTWQASKILEVGVPAAVRLGQTEDGLDTWTVGYTPSRVVTVWTGTGAPADGELSTSVPAVLWNALMQLASQNVPAEGWDVPADISVINVCDPSGMLPTANCPSLVSEVFLHGNEPVQADTLYRRYAVNRETGLLATVFTLPQLIEERVYLVVPAEARSWAEAAGLDVPPASYDAIQLPLFDEDVNITAPGLFSEVKGTVRITGTAAGEDFVSYRVLVGPGLNPEQWIQIAEGNGPVADEVLAEWNTTGLAGLYALQLQVIRSDQRVDTAIIQVTVTEDS